MKNAIRFIVLFVIMGMTNSLQAQNNIMCLTANIPIPASFDTVPAAALADDYYLWDNGKVLIVKFMNGSIPLQEKTKKIARQWEQAANIRFEFVTTGNSHIRIEFNKEGFMQSTIGTLAATCPQDKPTAFIDTSAFNNQELMQGMVLHLFGHVLGLQDEVYVPKNGNNWNAQVLNNYASTIKLSNATAQEVIQEKYNINHANWLKYDGQSIMASPIVKRLLVNSYPVRWNSNISTKDKALIGLWYPKKAVHYDNAAKPSINFTGLKMAKSDFKKGISFFPVFDFVSRGNGVVSFLLVLVDKEGRPIQTYNPYYNVLNQTGTFIRPHFVGYSVSAINKNNLQDMELFIPSFAIEGIRKEDGLFAIFKVFYQNFGEGVSGWVYVSKPYEIK